RGVLRSFPTRRSSDLDVVAVGQSEAGLGQAMPERAQHARLADAGLAREDGVTALAARLDEPLDRRGARGRHPEVGVGDFLGEGRDRKSTRLNSSHVKI